MERFHKLLPGILIAGAASLTVADQAASAWEASVFMDGLENSFGPTIVSGPGSYSWTTTQIEVNADSGFGSIPISPVTQTWDGIAWPDEILSDVEIGPDELTAEAQIEHFDVNDKFFGYADAFIYGTIPAGYAYGAGFIYEFELIIDPFTSVTVELDPFEDERVGLYLYADTEDVGNAFASVRLYSIDADLDGSGGVNDPFAIDSISLASTDTTDGQMEIFASFAYEFINDTPDEMVYNLQLSADVSIFTQPIPEPASAILLLLGSLGITARPRRQA